jgi:hypothetical protein
MRPASVARLQEDGVAHQPEDVEPPIGEAEQRPYPQIVLSHLEGPAQSIETPQVVALGCPLGMHLRIGLVVVGLHEDLVGADAGCLDGLEPRVIHGCRVHVHASDLTLPTADVVDVANAGRDEVGVVAWMLAEDHDEALVPLILQRGDLPSDVLHAERATDHVLVLVLEATIGAVVHAHVPDVQRCEQHDAVAIHPLFEVACGGKDLLAQLRIARVQ